jgi:hypothetical protein
VANEPKSLAGDRSKQPLFLPTVADGLARRVDVTGQGRFRDDLPGPHGTEELVLADDVLAVSHQMEQQVEHLRPDSDWLGAARELPPVRVDHVVLERVLHVALSSPLIAMVGKPLIAPRSRGLSRRQAETAGTGSPFSDRLALLSRCFGRKSKRNSIPLQGSHKAFQPPIRHLLTRRIRHNLALPCKPLEGKIMKIVVIGGTGLIGSKLVKQLEEKGHDAIAAAPNTGVNTITGEGLKEALLNAQVVVDLANAPVWEDKAVLEFFETSGRNLMAAEKAADVKHHLALSIVGSDRSPDSGYLRAKVAQENLIKASGVPYTILRSTQFFEFVGGIVKSGAEGDVVRPSPALFQPIASTTWSPTWPS